MSSHVENMQRWINDPVAFAWDNFGFTPDAWQADMLRAVVEHDRVAAIACKGPGKTALLAVIGLWFLSTRENAQIVATSISADNLRDGLWKELSTWYGKSKFLQNAFEFNAERIARRSSRAMEWWISARSWSKKADATQQANTLAGLHGKNIMHLGDEVGDYPMGVVAASEAMLANVTPEGGNEAKLVYCGNPTDPNGPLYKIATTFRHLWRVINITADPDDPKRTPRVSVEWVRQQIEMFGRDNPYVIVNVFGRFPPAGFNALLGPDEVSASMGKHYKEDEYFTVQKRLGIDVSRFGDDRTVIFPRQGLMAFNPVILRNARSNEVAARVAVAKDKWKSEAEYVDDTGGYGAGVIDSLLQAGHTPIPVNFSGKADDPRFFNKRTEMWWRMAEWVKRGGALPDDSELARELTAPTYSFQQGKIRLEEKEQIKARLGFSPDKGDALALTFAHPDMPSANPAEVYSLPGVTAPDRPSRKALYEYDPFADA